MNATCDQRAPFRRLRAIEITVLVLQYKEIVVGHEALDVDVGRCNILATKLATRCGGCLMNYLFAVLVEDRWFQLHVFVHRAWQARFSAARCGWHTDNDESSGIRDIGYVVAEHG